MTKNFRNESFFKKPKSNKGPKGGGPPNQTNVKRGGHQQHSGRGR